jgi:hypothetical protein
MSNITYTLELNKPFYTEEKLKATEWIRRLIYNQVLDHNISYSNFSDEMDVIEYIHDFDLYELHFFKYIKAKETMCYEIRIDNPTEAFFKEMLQLVDYFEGTFEGIYCRQELDVTIFSTFITDYMSDFKSTILKMFTMRYTVQCIIKEVVKPCLSYHFKTGGTRIDEPSIWCDEFWKSIQEHTNFIVAERINSIDARNAIHPAFIDDLEYIKGKISN